jgi:hypothetical protein
MAKSRRDWTETLLLSEMMEQALVILVVAVLNNKELAS